MDILISIASVIQWIATVLSGIAAAIAIYIFIAKRNTISKVIRIVMNYSMSLSINELKTKLEVLNDYHIDTGKDKIINVLSDILGQIKGNPKLKVQCAKNAKQIERFIKSESLTEPEKRFIISELRETLTHLNTSNYEEILDTSK